MLEQIKNLILDTLFPVFCLSCGQPEVWICDSCLGKIPLVEDRVCPVCEKRNTPSGQTCFSCKSAASLSGMLIAASYKNDLVSRAIHYYKYRFAAPLATPLASLLAKAIIAAAVPLPDIIIPVPLHRRRLRWRGFNQAELIAFDLSKMLTPGLTITVRNDILIRCRPTRPQMKIKNYKERQNNMRGAFSINPVINKKTAAEILRGKKILLVDDVATTGSTIFECADTLKKSGAEEIRAIVIARQSMG